MKLKDIRSYICFSVSSSILRRKAKTGISKSDKFVFVCLVKLTLALESNFERHTIRFNAVFDFTLVWSRS